MSIHSSTEFVRARSVDEAVGFLSADAETRVFAGGYSLMPLLKDGVETPERLVDVSGIDSLTGVSSENERLRVGALTTHSRIAASTSVRKNARALAEATDSVGDYQAKHRGTIGGNLVVADPKYDAPAAFLALGGRIVARGVDDRRTIGADEWFHGLGETALDPDELVTEVVVPDVKASGYVRTSEYSGYAIVGAAAALTVNDGVVEAARVAVNGAKPYPVRLPNVEKTLTDNVLNDDLRGRAADAALRGTDPKTLLANDAAAGDYRLRLVRSYCRRALERATPDS